MSLTSWQHYAGKSLCCTVLLLITPIESQQSTEEVLNGDKEGCKESGEENCGEDSAKGRG